MEAFAPVNYTSITGKLSTVLFLETQNLTLLHRKHRDREVQPLRLCNDYTRLARARAPTDWKKDTNCPTCGEGKTICAGME